MVELGGSLGSGELESGSRDFRQKARVCQHETAERAGCCETGFSAQEHVQGIALRLLVQGVGF